MPPRVIALLLVFVMLWSGVGTIEAPAASAGSSTAATLTPVDALGPSAAQTGSVEQHHLDDLPMQVQNDPAAGPLGLAPSVLMVRAASVLLIPVHSVAAIDVGPPFLAGPLRPPCSTACAG